MFLVSNLLRCLPAGNTETAGWPWAEETDPSVYAGRSDWPQISIVTPSFNQAQFLEETIRSVLLQNYPNLQYIVIDGGSTDGSVEIIKKYQRWIDFWVTEKDRGQSHAINKGLERCNGVWFNWINSDDLLMPNSLESLFKSLTKKSAYELTIGNVAEGPNIKNIQIRHPICLEEAKEISMVNHKISQPGMFYKKNAISYLKENLHLAMDYELWVNFLIKSEMNKIIQTEKVVSFFRVHKNSKTTRREKEFLDEEKQVLATACKQIALKKYWSLSLGGAKTNKKISKQKITLNKKLLKKEIVTKHLLGDLRKNIQTKKIKLFLPLLMCCLEAKPVLTLVMIFKETLKKMIQYERVKSNCNRTGL